jgi:hypothetical protein
MGNTASSRRGVHTLGRSVSHTLYILLGPAILFGPGIVRELYHYWKGRR